MADKVQENRVRRAATRRRLVLRKSPRRDPRAPDFDRFMVVDQNGGVVFGGHPHDFSATLDEVEAFLGYRQDDTAPTAPEAIPATLQGMLEAWLAEKPERMVDVFELQKDRGPKTPAEAAKALIAGQDRHFAVVLPAEHLLEVIEPAVADSPSEIGRAMVAVLKVVAGRD